MSILSRFKRIFILLLTIAIILFALSGVYATHNIDKLAYVIALGIDVGETENIKLSIQLSKPEDSSSGSAGGSSKNIVNSIECSSIASGIDLFNSYLSRRINLSHCKVVVLSEEVATNGISDYLYTLLNNIEMNAHANVIVSKSTAKDFLDSSEPELEDLASKYYETALNSSEYNGYTQNVTLIRFFSDYVDTFTEPVAILGAVNTGNNSSLQNYDVNTDTSNNTTTSDTDTTNNVSSSSNSPTSNTTGTSLESSSSSNNSYLAGQTPMTSKNNIENMGLAVFNGDRLVGELTGLETIYHLMVSNELESCTMSIPNPLGDSEYIDVDLRLNSSTKNKVDFVNGMPYISTSLDVKIRILSTTEDSTKDGSNYYSKENIELIEQSCNEYLKEELNNYLYKTAKEYKADIDSFGKYAVKHFITLQDWNEYNWLDNYENSIFNVEVNTSLKSGYTFL